jgi:hypothetical protein
VGTNHHDHLKKHTGGCSDGHSECRWSSANVDANPPRTVTGARRNGDLVLIARYDGIEKVSLRSSAFTHYRKGLASTNQQEKNKWKSATNPWKAQPGIAHKAQRRPP